MSLINSATEEARKKNIETEINAGKSPDEAVAIAHAHQREMRQAHGRDMPMDGDAMAQDLAEASDCYGKREKMP